jgi:hypothetical protein
VSLSIVPGGLTNIPGYMVVGLGTFVTPADGDSPDPDQGMKKPASARAKSLTRRLKFGCGERIEPLTFRL